MARVLNSFQKNQNKSSISYGKGEGQAIRPKGRLALSIGLHVPRKADQFIRHETCKSTQTNAMHVMSHTEKSMRVDLAIDPPTNTYKMLHECVYLNPKLMLLLLPFASHAHVICTPIHSDLHVYLDIRHKNRHIHGHTCVSTSFNTQSLLNIHAHIYAHMHISGMHVYERHVHPTTR